MKKTLEVGDVLYFRKYNELTGRSKVTRVTAKRAFVQVNERYERQFTRELMSNGSANEIGVDRYSRSYTCIETPELKAQWDEKKLRNNLAGLVNNHGIWPIETVKAVYDLLVKMSPF